MHSRQLQYTAKSFTAQQEALLHNRKFCCIAEKSILRQKLEKSSFCSRNWRKVPSATETEDKHHILSAVSIFLADNVQFAHKPGQFKFQLDQSQLPYSEHLGPVPQEATQPNTIIVPQVADQQNNKKAHHTQNFRILIYNYMQNEQDFG